MVKKRLKASNIDLTRITFAEFSKFTRDLRSLSQDDKVVQDLINDGYRYIFLDSAEDAGVEWVNELLEKLQASGSAVNLTEDDVPLQTFNKGDF